MARLDAGMASVEISSFCSDNCRYDRTGGGDEPLGNPHPDRWLYRDGEDFVLLDEPGAGVLGRIWLTSGGPYPACLNPAMHLKLYFGAATSPQVDMPLAQLFDGSTPPFTAPLVFDKDSGSGGYASYVPIAYDNGLRLAVTGLDQPGPCSGGEPPLLWYQFDVQRLPPGSVVDAFSMTDTFAQLRAFLAASGGDPWQRGLPATSTAATLLPGQSLQLAAGSGSGWVAGTRLQLDAAAWEQVRLAIDIDGTSVVSLPVARAVYVDTDDVQPARGPLFGLDAAGWLYLWWPMPFHEQYAVRLVADGLSAATPIQAAVMVDSTPLPLDLGVLHGAQRTQCGSGANHELDLLDRSGSGRLMALGGTYAAMHPPQAAYLEGDVRLQRDGMPSPAWQGSGLEDFFNGGFYFDWDRPYRQPWSGASLVDVHASSHLWRMLLADAPVFANGVRVLQEAGASPTEPVAMCTDTIAWWYQAPDRALVPVAHIELGDPHQRQRHAVSMPAGTTCAPLTSRFPDAAATLRTASVCRHASGDESFVVRLADPAAALRLRRIVDAAQPGQAARIVVNGVPAGWFAPVRPDPVRRWQVQEAPLRVAPGSTNLAISIQPLWGKHGDSGSFSASAWTLLASPGDHLFADGFEALAGSPAQAPWAPAGQDGPR